jgi:YhcH/YjgK/YiaL family protein
MIIDTLQNSRKYEKLNPHFKKGFEFLCSLNKDNFPVSKIELEGDELFALFHKGPGYGNKDVKLEAHKKYIDIHYVLLGNDLMGHKSTANCSIIHKAFNENDDCVLFNDAPNTFVKIKNNYFAIVFPEDAHSPLTGEDEVWKIILKVKVS